MWILRKVRVVFFRRLFIAVVILTADLFWASTFQKQLYSYFVGPADFSQEQLWQIRSGRDFSPRWIRLKADSVTPTGATQRIEMRRFGELVGGSVQGYFQIAHMGQYSIVAFTPAAASGNELVGQLVPLRQELFRALPGLDQLRQEQLLFPFVLDAVSIDQNFWAVPSQVAIGIAIGAILLFLYTLTVFAWPRYHPSIFRLFRGQEGRAALNDLSERLQSLDALALKKAFHTYLFASGFVLYCGFWRLRLLPMEDLVWVYDIVERDYVGRGPLRASQVVVLQSRWCKIRSVRTPDGEGDFISYLRTHYPWIPIGYSRDLARLWRYSRWRFWAMVRQRREEASTSHPTD